MKTLIFMILFFMIQCNTKGANSGPNLNYYLDRVYTGKTTNHLNINVPDPSSFFYSLEGSGFTADIPLGVISPIQPVTSLTTTSEGVFYVNLKIYFKDGFTLIDESLSWEYSTAKPLKPIVSLSKMGTADTSVDLLFSAANLGSKTSEFWIEGDLTNFTSSGSWNLIPKSLSVPLTLTDQDGIKRIIVKFRNIYGNESDAVTLSIEKKSIPPQNCNVVLNGTSTFYSTTIRAYMTADNSGDLYWRGSGDLLSADTPQLIDPLTHEVTLFTTEGSGPKNISIQLQDIASNTCGPFDFGFNVDPNYVPYGLTLNQGIPWTDSQSISLQPKYDHLPNDSIEMLITGDLEPNAQLNTWVPFADSVDVSLSPLRGNRNVYIQFRTSPDDESLISIAKIFLNLSFTYQANAISIDNPVGLSALSIEGCLETYQSVPYQSQYTCHKSDPTLRVTYFFDDGSSHTVEK